LSIPKGMGAADPIALSNSRLALIKNWWSEKKIAAA